MRLEDKTAVITGAGGHLGRGTGLRLAQEGAKVMINDINVEEALRTVEMIKERGGEALAHGADVTRTKEVADMIGQTLSQWGQIDILVNNAGDIRDALLVKMTDEEWDFVVDLNLKGSFLCARAAAPHMIARRYGKIVNTASMAYKGNVGQANYTSAKAGVVGLTLALGLELARYGINVNCVAPGIIDTPRTQTLDERTVNRLVKLTPLGHMGQVADIANAVLFLVSDESQFITRQVIHVAGGMEGF